MIRTREEIDALPDIIIRDGVTLHKTHLRPGDDRWQPYMGLTSYLYDIRFDLTLTPEQAEAKGLYATALCRRLYDLFLQRLNERGLRELDR